jgi:drug/metabolite transporter (DMT)-like permease
LAPPAEAGLINYLWPLLIVLFSARLPGSGGLRAGHVAGAALGLAGVAALFAGRGNLDFAAGALPGYAASLAAAFVWAGYSVLSARVGQVPTDAVAGFCLITAALNLACHLAFETTVWPADATQWGAVLLLGIGPVGAAFYLWDIGCKRGDVRLLGVTAYAAPVLSTLILVASGYASASPALALACLLIVAGALTAVWASRAEPKPV